MIHSADGGRGVHTARWRGFTLLELLVVLVILGLLVAYVAPNVTRHQGRSQVRAAQVQIEAFQKALEQYRLDTGRYPTTEMGLVALRSKPATEPKWAGPYLTKEVPAAPWGNPYVYRSPGSKGEFEVLSLGKDGQPGGSGEAEDITN